MGKTKFNPSWKKKYDWVRKSTTSVHSALCLPCGDSLDVSSGVSVLERHEKTTKHKNSSANFRTQTVFKSSSNAEVSITTLSASSKRILSTEDQSLNAEVIRCLDIVSSNAPFAEARGDNAKYRSMFPDSEIAKTYAQGPDKVKYMIQFGIEPVIKEIILDDLRGKPFSFHFDETTTSQTKKQYDGYATFYSNHFDQIVTVYLGTLFVGKCTAENLLNDLKILMERLNLNMHYIICISMDGPNVNMSFYDMLCDLLLTKGKTLIDVGTCSLHIVANAFGKGLKELAGVELDLNEFCVNLHSFFKLSAKRIEQYFTTDILMDLEPPQRMIRHAETRWLGIQRVLLRIMEQLKNIKRYFLKILPSDKKSFNGKNGVGSTTRYASIKKMITDERLMALISAVTFIAQEFKAYVVPLQSRSPLITVLFTKMQNLLQAVLCMFMKENTFLKNKLMPISKIKELDLSNPKNHKTKCELGSKYAKEVALLKDPLEQKRMDELMKNLLKTVCSYLLENLPLDKQVIRDARYLHPNQPLDNDRSTAAVVRLASSVWDSIGESKMVDLFRLKPLTKKFDFIDSIKKDFLSFKLEALPEDFIEKKTSVSSSATSKPSYWRKCYDLAGLEPSFAIDDGYQVGAERFWMKVCGLCDIEGREKYLNLGRLALFILLLPHGNADPERGFSVNKRLLEKHGGNLDEDTLESLRVVKDYLIQVGGPEHVKINKKMLDSCRSSRRKYQDYLDAKAKKIREENQKKEEEKEVEAGKKTNKDIDSRIEIVQETICFADALIEEGNKLLKTCRKKMVQTLFNEGQDKVELGVKRKSELNEELQPLKKKRV